MDKEENFRTRKSLLILGARIPAVLVSWFARTSSVCSSGSSGIAKVFIRFPVEKIDQRNQLEENGEENVVSIFSFRPRSENPGKSPSEIPCEFPLSMQNSRNFALFSKRTVEVEGPKLGEVCKVVRVLDAILVQRQRLEILFSVEAGRDLGEAVLGEVQRKQVRLRLQGRGVRDRVVGDVLVAVDRYRDGKNP
jgi:hypothetical protein